MYNMDDNIIEQHYNLRGTNIWIGELKKTQRNVDYKYYVNVFERLSVYNIRTIMDTLNNVDLVKMITKIFTKSSGLIAVNFYRINKGHSTKFYFVSAENVNMGECIRAAYTIDYCCQVFRSNKNDKRKATKSRT